MNKLNQHKSWFFWLLAAVFSLITASPSLEYIYKGSSEKEIAQTRLQKDLTSSLQQLRKDAQDAERLGKAMDEDAASAFLSPVDRAKVANVLEQQAAGTDLLHFTYSISPEKPATDSAITSITKELVTSEISLQAEAPDDISIYRFISGIKRNVPGKIKLQHLQISRTSQDIDPSLGPTNVRMIAKIEWLSNSSAGAN